MTHINPNYILWALLAAMYLPVFNQLYRFRWSNIDYSHAYFILPLSLWLVWRKRSDIRKLLTKKPEILSLGFFLFFSGLLIFIFGRHWNYLLLATISLIPVLFGLTIYLYGFPVARSVSFPILYLLLLVPPPLGVLDGITIPMRYGISTAVEWALTILRFPFTREGLLFTVNGYKVFMGAPCSGFRSLITMFSLALVYAYLNTGSHLRKFLLVIAVVPIALLGNFIRVFSVCLVTYYGGEHIAKPFHDISGYAIFLLLLLVLGNLDNLLERWKI